MMKKLLKKDLSKLSILLQQTSKNKFTGKNSNIFFSIKKIQSNKVSYNSFYKPISKI
ncbi:hypothetical protein SAMN05421846_10315 [Chryseobacterium taeanense]|uniref:Uncharacterized protein n=1 Tax=Chryseobacterium taeanense TaxID=311334 RepID=A0A1G8GL20_9FLAO|nr:hypothetical protein SAMN05421846_10315 [Chryseobacterium taeanense]